MSQKRAACGQCILAREMYCQKYQLRLPAAISCLEIGWNPKMVQESVSCFKGGNNTHKVVPPQSYKFVYNPIKL